MSYSGICQILQKVRTVDGLTKKISPLEEQSTYNLQLEEMLFVPARGILSQPQFICRKGS